MKTSFVLAAWLTVILLGCGCESKKEKVYRIGILVGAEALIKAADGFVDKMKEAGFIEGKNVIYDIQKTAGNKEEIKTMCSKFIADKVDLIVTVSHGAAVIAKEKAQGTGIPVLFTIAVTQEGHLVKSLREPGGNITGVRYPIPDMAMKRLEYLLELKPETKRVLVTYAKGYPPAMGVLKGLRPLAASRKVTLVEVPVTTLEEITQDFNKRTQKGVDVDAILLVPEPFSNSDKGWAIIRSFAQKSKIPVAAVTKDMVYTGAALSYDSADYNMGELAAPLAKKILNGTPAGTIPVVSPEMDLRINYKVTQKLGLPVPESMLKIAAEIIRK